ncbi:MAG: 2-oxoacid:ferredoxin oxidoreductase subunit alpha [Desulfitobacteriia bacterium]|jgi:pyruvate ferredoxin oxidoreductase delta subunit
MVKEVPIVPTANPGSLAEISAAPSWREYRPVVEDPAKVNPEVILFCPDGALSSAGGEVAINLSVCKGCGICAAESEGIVMIPEYTGPRGVFGVKEGSE